MSNKNDWVKITNILTKKLVLAQTAAELLLNAIAQARDEGETIPDWLNTAEDSAIDILNVKEDTQ